MQKGRRYLYQLGIARGVFTPSSAQVNPIIVKLLATPIIVRGGGADSAPPPEISKTTRRSDKR